MNKPKYTDSTYEKIQNVLKKVDYLEGIKVRDFKFVATQSGLTSPNEKIRKSKIEEIIDKRKKYLDDLVALDLLVNNYYKYLELLEDKEGELKLMQKVRKIELKEKGLKKMNDINLRKRQYQLLQYQNYINEETVHLLWVLFVCLIICCFIVMGNVLGLKGLDKILVMVLVFTILGFYCIYLFKKLSVDNVNINIYDIKEFDYNKPTEAELTRDKSLQDKLYRLRDHSTNKGNCDDKKPVPTTKTEKIDEELEKIRKDLGTSSSEGLITYPDPIY